MADACAAEKKTQYTQAEIDAIDTQELMLLYKATGDEALRWPLVLRYEHLVETAAMQVRSVYSGFAQVEDIINEGILTLLSAIDKYDPDKGVKFETFVGKRIRGMIIDLARQQDWIPRTVRRRNREIEAAVTELSNQLGHHPTDQEIADHLNISLERYQKDMADIALSNVLSLDALMNMYDNDGPLVEMLSSDADMQPENVLQCRELQDILASGICTLRKNEQIVLSLHYEKNLQFNEIAQVMELSAPRISQIHAKAIEKLRNYMEPYLGETHRMKTSKKKVQDNV